MQVFRWSCCAPVALILATVSAVTTVHEDVHQGTSQDRNPDEHAEHVRTVLREQ
jgi:hypothetical protein